MYNILIGSRLVCVYILLISSSKTKLTWLHQNTGNNSAAETPFGGIKESGRGKEGVFLITESGTMTVKDI